MIIHKISNLIMALILAVIMFQCQKSDFNTNSEGIDLKNMRSEQAYISAQEKLDKGEKSDPFVINSVSINDNELKMYIEVSYSGGCQKHEFALVWPEVITFAYPPNFSIILNHDANEDNCEAWLTKTLIINLQEDVLRLSDQEIKDMIVTVINGSNPNEKVHTN